MFGAFLTLIRCHFCGFKKCAPNCAPRYMVQFDIKWNQ